MSPAFASVCASFPFVSPLGAGLCPLLPGLNEKEVRAGHRRAFGTEGGTRRFEKPSPSVVGGGREQLHVAEDRPGHRRVPRAQNGA